MAVVLYQGAEKPKGSQAASGSHDEQYKQVRSKIDSLMAESREKLLLGLSNQGATCYMNSLLQALFMTPEVRSLIYSYETPAPELKTNLDFNIPYQL